MTTYLLAAEALGKAHIGNMIFVSVSMLILLGAIKHFAWGPITKIFQDREDKIAGDIDAAEKDRQEAEALRVQRIDNLNASKSEALTIVKNAKDVAEQTRQTFINETNEEILAMKEKAKENIEIERSEALTSVKNDVAALSVQIASKILQQELSAEQHTALIESYIEGLGKK